MSTNVTHNNKHSKINTNSKDLKLNDIDQLSDSTLMDLEAFNTEYILKLTRATLLAGRIPNDDSIVPLVGDGSELDNSKAVETWIRSHINMLAEITPQNQIEKIIEEIDNRLEEVKTGYLSCK